MVVCCYLDTRNQTWWMRSKNSLMLCHLFSSSLCFIWTHSCPEYFFKILIVCFSYCVGKWKVLLTGVKQCPASLHVPCISICVLHISTCFVCFSMCPKSLSVCCVREQEALVCSTTGWTRCLLLGWRCFLFYHCHRPYQSVKYEISLMKKDTEFWLLFKIPKILKSVNYFK